jgi:DNA-directed RNA polymerase specialized sigma24 family protein
MTETRPDEPAPDRYARRPEVLDEIRQALARDPSTWARSGFQPETMAHLVRHLRAEKANARVMGDLILAVDRHVTRIVARFARGYDRVTTEEIALEVGRGVMELCLGEGPPNQAEFLEASFLTAVKRRTIDAVNKRNYAAKAYEAAMAVRKVEKPRPHDKPPDLEGVQGETVADPEEVLLSDADPPPAAEKIRLGLAAIKDPRHREAVILHYLKGWPISDKDPMALTLCSHFDVTDRAIRKWIATAFGEMRRAIGDKS